MVVGGGGMAAGGKKWTEGLGGKNDKKGKGEEEKGVKRLKNASLRVKNSKKNAFAPPVASTVGEKNDVPKVVGGGNDRNV